MMEVVIIALLIVILITLFLVLTRNHSNQDKNQAFAYLESEKTRIELINTELRAAIQHERDQRITAEESLKAQHQKLLEQEQHINNLHQQFKIEFENIANKILHDKAATFSEKNKENMDQILRPLKENIKAFEEKVDKVYKDESAERNKLSGVLKEMMDHSRQIQSDANNLTRALKGDNKKQGNWGEVVLERVLERSGLVKDREYRVQANFSTDNGERVYPDVVIDLPDNKNLIIDSKVSLLHYEKLIGLELGDEKSMLLKLHIQSLKAHIDNLSSKNYHHLNKINSPDFVLLFIPIESMFSITVQTDHEIFNYAWDKKVVIVSPTTLLATLRTIASIWKIDRQNKNVNEIASEAGALYDKFVGFLEDMEKIGKYINLVQKSHDDAFKKISTGSGNLIGKVKK